MTLEERLRDLERQLALLTAQETQHAAQHEAVRAQRLKCEGAVQVVRLLVEEEKAKHSAPPAAPAPESRLSGGAPGAAQP